MAVSCDQGPGIWDQSQETWASVPVCNRRAVSSWAPTALSQAPSTPWNGNDRPFPDALAPHRSRTWSEASQATTSSPGRRREPLCPSPHLALEPPRGFFSPSPRPGRFPPPHPFPPLSRARPPPHRAGTAAEGASSPPGVGRQKTPPSPPSWKWARRLRRCNGSAEWPLLPAPAQREFPPLARGARCGAGGCKEAGSELRAAGERSSGGPWARSSPTVPSRPILSSTSAPFPFPAPSFGGNVAVATSLRTTAGFRPEEAGVRGRAGPVSPAAPGVVASALSGLPYLPRSRTQPEARGTALSWGPGDRSLRPTSSSKLLRPWVYIPLGKHRRSWSFRLGGVSGAPGCKFEPVSSLNLQGVELV